MPKNIRDRMIKAVVIVVLLLFVFSIILPILPFARGW